MLQSSLLFFWFQSAYCPNARFWSLIAVCQSSGRGVTAWTSSCWSSWTTARSWRSRAGTDSSGVGRHDLQDYCSNPWCDSWQPFRVSKVQSKMMLQLLGGLFVLAKRRRTESRREQRRVEEKGQWPLFGCGAAGNQLDSTKRHHFIETKTTCSTHVKSFTVRKETGKKPSLGVNPPFLMSTASSFSQKRGTKYLLGTRPADPQRILTYVEKVYKFTGTWKKTGQHSSHLRKCLPALSSINFKGRDSSWTGALRLWMSGYGTTERSKRYVQ